VVYREHKNSIIRNEPMIIQYINKYESLQPLYLVIRLLLHNMGLDDPSNGGLSSFGIILLIICMLQSMAIRGQDISTKSPNLGMLLLSFFNLYGNHIDFTLCDLYPSPPGGEVIFPFHTTRGWSGYQNITPQNS